MGVQKRVQSTGNSDQSTMSPLAILLLFTLCHSLEGALGSIPDFKASDDDLLKLVSLMRTNDKEKPDFCDVHINYQVSDWGAVVFYLFVLELLW